MDRIEAFKIFVRVVETASFSKAARELGVTQPTVTRHVAGMEQHLGARLLNRNTRRLSMTELGRIYYDKSKALLESYAATESLVHGHKSPVHGRTVSERR